MSNGIQCTDCGEILAENALACPKCGSKNRTISVGIHRTTPSFGGVTIRSVEDAFSESDLLIQSVVVRGEKADEGELIIAVTLPWYGIIEEVSKDPDFAYKMKPRMWEEMVAGIYERAGFDEVILTPHKGDRGRDVIAVKKGVGIIRVIDQVKAYRPGHHVTHEDVRALMGVVAMDEASKGFLTTTSDFAPTLREDPLIKQVLGSRIELINGKMLIKRLVELSKNRAGD